MSPDTTGFLVWAAPLIITLIALGISLWQGMLSRRALQAQSLLDLRSLHIQTNLSKKVKIIASLKPYTTYDEFQQAENDDVQLAIRDVAEFLNFAARFVREGLLPRKIIWDIYFDAYRLCYHKLGSWWVTGIRKQWGQPREFVSFELMCYQVAAVSDKAVEKYNENEDRPIIGYTKQIAQNQKRTAKKLQHARQKA